MNTSTLADVLERVLDKGIVIAGDIKVNLADVELLTIQIRLVICSVEKAQEMGMDWWVNHPIFSSQNAIAQSENAALARMEERMSNLEAMLARSLSTTSIQG